MRKIQGRRGKISTSYCLHQSRNVQKQLGRSDALISNYSTFFHQASSFLVWFLWFSCSARTPLMFIAYERPYFLFLFFLIAVHESPTFPSFCCFGRRFYAAELRTRCAATSLAGTDVGALRLSSSRPPITIISPDTANSLYRFRLYPMAINTCALLLHFALWLFLRGFSFCFVRRGQLGFYSVP